MFIITNGLENPTNLKELFMFKKLMCGLKDLSASKRFSISCTAIIIAIAIAVVTFMSSSIYTVKVFDGEKTFTVRTLSNNLVKALSAADLKSDEYNVESTSVNGRITSVEISYTYPVYISCGEVIKAVNFNGGTVADALALAGYTVDEYDMVEPALDTVIEETAYIDYYDVSYVSGSYTETVEYESETVYSSTTAKGVTKTLTKGSNGQNLVSYTETVVNGVVTETVVTSTEVIKAVVNEQILVGTKDTSLKTSEDVKCVSVLKPEDEIVLDENGNPVNYKSVMTVRATAYTYTGNPCSTGVYPKPGYIAVNPKVIPYGTKLYIKSPDGSIVYGYAVAADTGSFIKNHPTGIDLFMTTTSACINFGVQQMEVYILE